MERISRSFPDDIREVSVKAYELLKRIYEEMHDSNAKEDALKTLLKDRSSDKICIVVPKAWYAEVIKNYVIQSVDADKSNITVVTANRFDQTEIYDAVISVGDITGKKYDAFRCNTATEIIPILYSFEKPIFKAKRKKTNELQQLYQERSYHKYVIEEEFEEDNDEAKNVEEAINIGNEVDRYIEQINTTILLNTIPQPSSSAYKQETEIAAVVHFESGEMALLTPHYKAYVYDEDSGDVLEKDIDKLQDGDSVIFTRNDAETHDIVDDILGLLINNGQCKDEELEKFKLARRWKQLLRIYIRINKLTPKQVAARISSVQEETVRTWLDSDAHTVGPQKLESLRQIGILTKDPLLKDTPEIVFEACKYTRAKRKGILKGMGAAIYSRYGGKAQPIEDPVQAAIYERIATQADVLTITTITPVSRTVPMYMSNRPINA